MADSQFIGPNFCAARNIRKADRIITRFYDEILKPTDLRITQFSLMATLFTVGSMLITQLADELVMDRTTLTRNLKPLEKRGLIRIEPGEDRRTRMVILTNAGRELFFDAFPLWQQAQTKVLSALGDDEYKHLLKNLSSVLALAS